jgi:hypothetical protein
MIQRYQHAAELPEAWDGIAETVFRSRAFLEHCERFNPCKQRYYGRFDQGELVAGAIAYDLRLDLLTYLKVRSPLPMTVIGVPCSVAWPGLLGRPTWTTPLCAGVLERERGLVLGLNIAERPTLTGLAWGLTLPTVVLEHDFADMDAYVAALRSDYRRRYHRIVGAMEGAVRHEGPCSELNERAYQLYVGAYERSEAKLELLSHRFLAELPEPFRLVRFERHGRLLGWHISAVEPGRTTFFMGGVDQERNEAHRSYFNLLFDVVRVGIEAGSPVIDLGQTAETPKLRCGGKPRPRVMFGWHRSSTVRRALRHGAPLLSYRAELERHRVFEQ